MDRSIVYTQEQGRSTDFLFAQRAAMIGLAKLSAAVLGTSTLVNGLACTPTSPASMQVQVGAGEIYAMGPVDATDYGVLPADTDDSILKQGISLAATTLNCPAPVTAGYSINYLVQASYQDSDTTNVVLPYFNSANPSQPLSGQNNSGTSQPTKRQGAAVIGVKAGAAATTGTQTTPAPDAGYVGLYVVTVANGQTTITSSSITQLVTAPIIPAGIIPAIQSNAYGYALDTGTANTYQAAYTPAITAVTDGMVLRFKAAHANTSDSTFAPNGMTASPIWGANHAPLVGGEIIANGEISLQWNSSLNSTGAWVLSVGMSQSAADARYMLASSEVGSIRHFAHGTTPAGYLKANGAAISRTTYAALFSAIGTTFGVGDGATTFNVPDLRGEFLRGYDDGRGVDSGRGFGSSQAGQNEAHTHGVTDPGHAHVLPNAVTAVNSNTGLGSSGATANSPSTTTNTTGISIVSSGGTEARPRNIALLACIKY